MSEYFPFDVFLSHSSKDKTVVRTLADRLRSDGLKVWFDEWEIKPGDSIPAKIEEGLEHSRVLVLCMSANAFGSDWAQLESGTFQFRDPLNKERRFIPLRLDDAPIKGSLAQFQHVNWQTPETQAQEYAKLIEACQPPSRPVELNQAQQGLQLSILSLGHTASVESVAWSPDGRRALSGASDHTVRLWEVESGLCLRVFEGHIGRVNSVVWSPDGRRALSGAEDKSVRLWDVESGLCLRVFEDQTDKVWSVAWSPDGRRALSGADDNTVRLWDVESGLCLRVLEGHISRVNSVAWSPDGRHALSGADDRTVRLWNVESGLCLRVFKGHTDSVTSVAWSPDGRRALSAVDRTLQLWEIESGLCLRVLKGHTNGVLSVTWSPDGRRALSGAWDNTVRLWEVESGKCLRVLEGHTARVLSVAWSPDGRRALSGAFDRTVRLWEVESGLCQRVFEGQTDKVWSVVWSPDGRRALSGTDDKTVRLWEVESGLCLRVFEGHTDKILSVAWSPDGRCGLSGSTDKTVRLWEVESGLCQRVLEGHTDRVWSVAWSPDGRRVLSGAYDKTVRLWEVESGRCLRVLEGHTDGVMSVAWSPDGRRVLSGAYDKTVRLWEVESGQCLRVFESHTDGVMSVAWSPDGRRTLSGAHDKTVRLWEVESGQCLHVLEGHTGSILSVVWSPDGRCALSGANDNTLRLWDIESGLCLRVLEGHTGSVRSVVWSPDGKRVFSAAYNGVMRIWSLNADVIALTPITGTSSVSIALTGTATGLVTAPAPPAQLQYTNAKVLLVGDTNAGKTGMTERLVHDRPPQGGSSTSGTWATQYQLKDLPQKSGWEREVWLWDFGGQADQRLIHQLYLDGTALVLLMFDADRESVLPGLREWQQALARSKAHEAPTFLLAGRTDVGNRFDREKVRAFAQENRYEYFETSAETGRNIPELRKAMLEKIPWERLTPHTSLVLFKQLKDEILKLRDEGMVLATFKELESVLRNRLPIEVKFADARLDTVVRLLDGPGVVKELNFGSYILLRPEWINIYAQAVIRTLRAAESGLGCLPVRNIMDGNLIFQTKQVDGKVTDEKRLTRKEDEQVVLQAMEQMLLERRLCLQQDGDLVFPSYFGLERPVGPVPFQPFVSYTIRGFLDDIYASLVVKLAHSEAFKLKELWRDAADFETLAEKKIVGIKLVRGEDGHGDLLAHHTKGVSREEQIIFANYIHKHLKEKSTEEVQRQRYYTCPHCHEPVMNRKLAMERLENQGKTAQIRCQRCEEFMPLWDAMEQLFADEILKRKIDALCQQENTNLDSRRLGQLLVHEVSARIHSANQKCHEIPGNEDEGIDMVVEFTDDEGRGTGKHMYLQLKAGNSYLKPRKKDDAEIFTIRKPNWVKQWIRQDGPMMLVIGTFSEDSERDIGREKKSFDEVRWMEIGQLLKDESANGTKPVKQIIFKGTRLDAMSVRRWRKEKLGL